MIRLGRSAFLKSLKVPSETGYIKKVSSRISESLLPFKVGADRVFDIKLCVEEAVRNAIVHGNHSDKRRSVKISYKIDAHKIVIEVEDEGNGFDHRFVVDPTQGDNVMKNSGRGVYLIKKLMDSVDFNKTGNKIIMTKHFK